MTVKMEPDFSGYATKAGLKCSDGRTIMPEAFQHMDAARVPLVWQHGHSSADNVLGHAILEKRDDGVYAHGFFNDTPQGQNAKKLVVHGDITALSIYANQLVEKSKQVFHGMIREVSLVLSGANPGALIEHVSIAHSDGDVETLDDEAIIFTGETLEHGAKTYTTQSTSTTKTLVDGVVQATRTSTSESSETLDDNGNSNSALAYSDLEHAANGATLQDVYDTLDDDQKNLVHYMVSQALAENTTGSTSTAKHSDDSGNETGAATDEGDLAHQEGTEMRHNVFETNGKTDDDKRHVLSHEDVKGIVADAMKGGSLREAVESYALKHGIDDIDMLFPEATLLNNQPDWISRRVEWVAGVLNGTRHTPFSRIKTRQADITHDEARAKGYVKGSLKKEEFFGLSQRVTTPTTVYKKQSLDRDDVIDITDFDVVVWLKGEMRLMLEEEIAGAVLVGDGRAVDDEDKIKDPMGSTEGAGIRAIVNDHELYVTTVEVPVGTAADTDYNVVVEEVMRARRFYKGTGTPTFYTTVQTAVEMLLSKDLQGRRRWNNKTELAAALGVSDIVEVEVLDRGGDDLLGIIVNLADYAIGADRGGEISLFDDFDIDYNKFKYLIETRVSGALTKIKSALVIRRAPANSTAVNNVTAPTYNSTTHVVTIPTKLGVVYKNADTDTVLTAGAQPAIAAGESLSVVAEPASGYYFPENANDIWEFSNNS